MTDPAAQLPVHIYDQALAGAGKKLDALGDTVQKMIASGRSEQFAVESVVVMVKAWDHTDLEAIAGVAALRASREGDCG